MRLTLWAYTVISIPLYLWFLHDAAGRWAEQLPPGDSLRLWLPLAMPGAAFSFTLVAALSWWVSATEAALFWLGRRGGRFLIVSSLVCRCLPVSPARRLAM